MKYRAGRTTRCQWNRLQAVPIKNENMERCRSVTSQTRLVRRPGSACVFQHPASCSLAVLCGTGTIPVPGPTKRTLHQVLRWLLCGCTIHTAQTNAGPISWCWTWDHDLLTVSFGTQLWTRVQLNDLQHYIKKHWF